MRTNPGLHLPIFDSGGKVFPVDPECHGAGAADQGGDRHCNFIRLAGEYPEDAKKDNKDQPYAEELHFFSGAKCVQYSRELFFYFSQNACSF